MTDYAEAVLLPEMLRTTLRTVAAPDIRLRRIARLFEPPSQELESGIYDIAIGFFEPPASAVSAIRYQRLLDEPRVCICRKGHTGVGARFTLAQYCALQHAAVAYDDGPPTIDRVLAARGLRRHVAVTAQGVLAIPRIVAYTDLLAVVPRRVVEHSGVAHRLRVLKVPFDAPAPPTTMIWHERSARHGGTSLVRHALAAAAARLK